MKKDLVDLVIILDKSGSMSGLEKDVVGGFNSLIKNQKELEQDVLVTTILFDGEVKCIGERVNIKDIKDLTEKDYCPRGSTALLDAIGGAISFIKTKHMTLEDKNKPSHVIFSIMTDGYENSSREYTYHQIKNMITNAKKEGWDFLFQAANIDEIAEGEKLGFYKEDINGFEANSTGVLDCSVCASKRIKECINKKKK